MEREELISKIKEILPFVAIWEDYEKKRRDLESKISGTSNKIHHLKEGNVVVFFMVGAIYGFILSLFFMVAISKIGLFSPYIWFGFIAVVAGIYAYFAKKSNDKNIAGTEAKVVELNEQYRILKAEFAKTKSPWDNKIYSIFPKDYAYPSTIKTIYGYLVNNRADNLKEAINLFEQERQQREQQRQMQIAFDAYDKQIADMQRNQSELEQRVADAEFQATQAYIQNTYK